MVCNIPLDFLHIVSLQLQMLLYFIGIYVITQINCEEIVERYRILKIFHKYLNPDFRSHLDRKKIFLLFKNLAFKYEQYEILFMGRRYSDEIPFELSG